MQEMFNQLGAKIDVKTSELAQKFSALSDSTKLRYGMAYGLGCGLAMGLLGPLGTFAVLTTTAAGLITANWVKSGEKSPKHTDSKNTPS